MRWFPQLDGLPHDGARPLGAVARLRPADGAHGHQRDGGERRQVPPQDGADVHRETRVGTAEGALAGHGDSGAVSTVLTHCDPVGIICINISLFISKAIRS